MATERLYVLFQDVADAERAIGALEDHGIKRDSIGVVARRPGEQEEGGRVRTEFTRLSDGGSLHQGEPAVAYEAQPGALPPAALAGTVAPTSSVDTPDNVEAVGKTGLTTTTPQDAAAGAAVGSGFGLVAGLLAAAAALAIPGVGIILGGGALAAALGAAAATTAAGAVAGGVAGYLRDMGMPEHAAQRLADRVHEGDYLITIDADTSRYDDLKKLMEKYNAVGIDTDGLAAGAGIPPAATVVPVEAMQQVPTSSVSSPPSGQPRGLYERTEGELTDPVLTETPASPAPRVPANPGLAQETEPITVVSAVPPGRTPDEELAQVEQARANEREVRDATT